MDVKRFLLFLYANALKDKTIDYEERNSICPAQ